MSSSLSLLLGSSRVRGAALALALVMAGAILTPVAAWAVVPSTVPEITAPTDAATVTDTSLTVTATSTAPQVRFVFDDRAGDPDFDKTVAVAGGVATTTFATTGSSGTVTVIAFDCDETAVCNTADSDGVSVTVDLSALVITAPSDNDVVQSSVTVQVQAPGAAVRFFVDGDPRGLDAEAPFRKEISLGALGDGSHTISVSQCSSSGDYCDGAEDSVVVLKDTKGPQWSDLNTSNKTVFPVNDNYKDSTVLSARVGETSSSTKVEIRKAGGPLVRTISLGRVDAGKVRATWNGRKSNGDLAAKGKYLFRFVGTDRNGVVGRSGDKVVYVSDKKLVKKTVTKTVSALSSGLGDSSGDCSRVVAMRALNGYGRQWKGGLQWQSNYSRNCSGGASVALSAHVVGTDNAIRYGTFQVSAYGGAALTRGGAAKILYVKKNQTWGARQGLSTSLGWHAGDRVKMDPYLIGKGGKLVWAVATLNGNWYDIKEFKISYTVTVLR
jgi:FlgD Ig-like domain/Bacterial Ig domain